jgi:sulfur relay (sulfurtransferase) DsrF/TusC family protein
MTAKRSRSYSSRSKNILEDRERTWVKAGDAAHAIKELIRSMKMSSEQKITLDDGINNLVNELESTTSDQKKLLAAYKKFLEYNIEVVNRRLKKKD